jgi:transposase
VAGEFRNFFILMLMDRAGWHRSAALRIPENLRIIPLPPHCPELNPAEHIWDEVRENRFHNRAFGSLDEVEDELCAGLVTLADNPDRVRSLTSFPYLNATL